MIGFLPHVIRRSDITMKTLYLECNMGAAGDMLMAALLELLPDRQRFLDTMNGLGLPGVEVTAAPAVRCGITGTHVTVTVHGVEEDEHLHDHDQEHHHHHHAHTSLAEIAHIIDHLDLPRTVRDNAKAVYGRIAAAESQVHGRPVEEVHFHEVGAWDAVADVVGVCLLMDWLAPERIVASPVHVGSGQVKCAHGLLPVPAPATALLLKDVPIYGGQIRGELCTPTGAALLTQFAGSFGPMPVMTVEQTGYGMGTKEFESANCVRAFLGRTRETGDEIRELSCNLDDMTPEAVGFAQEVLLEAGALDVFTTAIGMKKSRPGVLLTCLCRPEDEERMAELLLRHTTTLGVRVHACRRYTLSRTMETVETRYGPIRVKHAGGKSKAEYEDVAQAARTYNVTLAEVLQEIP